MIGTQVSQVCRRAVFYNVRARVFMSLHVDQRVFGFEESHGADPEFTSGNEGRSRRDAAIPKKHVGVEIAAGRACDPARIVNHVSVGPRRSRWTKVCQYAPLP